MTDGSRASGHGFPSAATASNTLQPFLIESAETTGTRARSQMLSKAKGTFPEQTIENSRLGRFAEKQNGHTRRNRNYIFIFALKWLKLPDYDVARENLLIITVT